MNTIIAKVTSVHHRSKKERMLDAVGMVTTTVLFYHKSSDSCENVTLVMASFILVMASF